MVTLLTSLSSEVLLRILDNLEDARDLVRFRQVSRRMYDIGGDALLWRDLFIHTYLQPSLDTIAGQRPRVKRRRLSYSMDAAHDSAASSRVIKRLPMLQDLHSSTTDGNERNVGRVDWYTLFKVSRNWQTGNFSSRQLHTLEGIRSDAIASIPKLATAKATANAGKDAYEHPRTLIDSTSSHIFASMHSQIDHAKTTPVLFVYPSHRKEHVSSAGEQSQEPLARFFPTHRPSNTLDQTGISALAVDKGQAQGSSVRLFVGYSDGESSLIYFNTATNTFHDEVHVEADQSGCIASAALHSAMLVTCTMDFRIRSYHASMDSLRLLEERRSYSCHWPASLRLEPLIGKENDSCYRLNIAYSSPVYPLGWTVGLQEIVIGAKASISSRSASARRSHVVTCLDTPSKDDKKALCPLHHDTAERRNQVGRLTSLSYEEPFIVVGTKDNNVVCFRVTGSTSRNMKVREPPVAALELKHVCTFQGHTGTVHSVSLNEGRCVTGGSDGSVRIWRLGDEEAAVAKAAGLLTTIDASLRRGLGKVVTIGSAFTSEKRKRALPAAPLSLSDILREARAPTEATRSSSNTSAAVRLVTSAFDHIISVSAVKTSANAANGNMTCRAESSVDWEEEQVQIWNFAQ